MDQALLTAVITKTKQLQDLGGWVCCGSGPWFIVVAWEILIVVNAIIRHDMLESHHLNVIMYKFEPILVKRRAQDLLNS